MKRKMGDRLISTHASPGFIQRVFLGEKLNNWTGFILLALIATVIAVLFSTNLLLGIGVAGGLVAIFILMACLLSPITGLYIIMLYGFAASAISRFIFNDQVPAGAVIDILVLTTFVGLFMSRDDLKKNVSYFFRARPVIWYTAIVVYLTLELVNPIGHSFGGWLQVMRKVFESFVIVFIAFNVLHSMPRIRRFISTLFVLALVLALYGCFQQWHGLTQFEVNWVNADELRYGLISIWGEYRKFSLLGGPTEFGIVMAACALFFMLIGWNENRTGKKVLYFCGALFMILGMSYSGTRTANAMLAGGIAMFIMLTINTRASKIFAVLAVLAFLFVMYAPIYSSATLLRFRSTFSASQDASYNVREHNRQTVQPFIWSHPVGSGLSTTGGMGERYNPGNPNAGFPTDSSYLNKALESGWIGLLMTCVLYFTMLQYIFRGYFSTRNKEFRNLFAASSAFFFSFFIGEIAQEAVGVFSNMVIYFPLFGVVVRLRQLSEVAVASENEI